MGDLLLHKCFAGLPIETDDVDARAEQRSFLAADALRLKCSLRGEDAIGRAACYTTDEDATAPDVYLGLGTCVCYLCNAVLKGFGVVLEFVVHPCDASRQVVPDVLHLCLIAAPKLRILVHLGIHDGPTDEVEALRLHQFACHAIHVCLQFLYVDTVEVPDIGPQFTQVSSRFGVGDDDAVHDGFEAACRRAFCAVDVVRLVADGVGAVVVLEGEVEVPDGFHIELRVVAVLVHVGAPISVGIARQFTHEEVPLEAGQVEVLAVAQLFVFPVALV